MNPLIPNHPLWIETTSGRIIDFMTPHPSQISIHDIIHALSQQMRFASHTVLPYTTLEHSLYVCNFLMIKHNDDPLLGMHGLLHCAHAAYIGDIIQPLKSIPEVAMGLKPIERRLLTAIYQKFDIPEPYKHEAAMVNEANEMATLNSAKRLVNSRAKNWHLPKVSAENREVMNQLKLSIKHPSITLKQEYFRNSFYALLEKIQAMPNPETINGGHDGKLESGTTAANEACVEKPHSVDQSDYSAVGFYRAKHESLDALSEG